MSIRLRREETEETVVKNGIETARVSGTVVSATRRPAMDDDRGQNQHVDDGLNDQSESIHFSDGGIGGLGQVRLGQGRDEYRADTDLKSE